MFILMDKPRATSWFEFGTILEIQPASGFDLALPCPQILNPLSPSSPFLFTQATIASIFISWESCYPSYPSPHDHDHPPLLPYKPLMIGADKSNK